MRLNRRSVIELSVAGAATLTLGGRIASGAALTTEELHDSAAAFFGDHGFRGVPAHGIITGQDFNGGLVHDPIHPHVFPRASMGVQLVARVDDIAERDRPGVLACFNVLAVQSEPSPDPGALFSLVMNFLVDERGLDPSRMLFVSTAQFKSLLDEADGLSEAQFLERSQTDVETAGDGSGLFAPGGHPYQPRIPTVGIYYPLPGSEPSGDLFYPPDGYIEIAEVAIAPIDGESDGPEGACIGLDRLAMAEGKPALNFDENRLNLLRIIEDEAKREGKDLPPGYAKFASL